MAGQPTTAVGHWDLVVTLRSPLGAGWNFKESDAYGIALGELRDRSDRLEEGVEVIKSLLENTTTNHKGRFFELTDAWCEPKPVQDKIPVVIGGKGKLRTLRTVAKFADQWDMTFPESPAAWLELSEILQGHCDKIGRDSSEIARSIHLGFDTETAPAEMAEQAESFFDIGVDIVVWSMRGPMDPARLAPLAQALTT